MRLIADIKTAVNLYCKIGSTTQEIALVAQSINRVLWDLTRNQTIPELLKSRTAITCTAMMNGTPVLLPVDFIREQLVIFHADTAAREWNLAEATGKIPPAVVYGKPTSYRILSPKQLVSNSTDVGSILCEPYSGIATGEKIYLNYYAIPVDTDTTVLGNEIAQEVEDRAIAYCLNYFGKIPQATTLLANIRTPPSLIPTNENPGSSSK